MVPTGHDTDVALRVWKMKLSRLSPEMQPAGARSVGRRESNRGFFNPKRSCLARNGKGGRLEGFR